MRQRKLWPLFAVLVFTVTTILWAQQAVTPPRGNQVKGSVTLTTATETTILSANTVKFIDLAYILVCSTNTTTADRIDFRSATGGPIIVSVLAPINGCTAVNPG